MICEADRSFVDDRAGGALVTVAVSVTELPQKAADGGDTPTVVVVFAIQRQVIRIAAGDKVAIPVAGGDDIRANARTPQITGEIHHGTAR
ncbi:MAG: hypothetical protein U0232_27170 [Thermomicrobiales bacterium]